MLETLLISPVQKKYRHRDIYAFVKIRSIAKACYHPDRKRLPGLLNNLLGWNVLVLMVIGPCTSPTNQAHINSRPTKIGGRQSVDQVRERSLFNLTTQQICNNLGKGVNKTKFSPFLIRVNSSFYRFVGKFGLPVPHVRLYNLICNSTHQLR